MFRLSSLFALIAFTAWILPLGAFINSSQEKKACDGKRAFHMCSMMAKVHTDSAPKTLSYSSATGVDKNAKSSAGGGADDYLMVNKKVIFRDSLSHFRDFYLIAPSNPSLYRLDVVPKVSF